MIKTTLKEKSAAVEQRSQKKTTDQKQLNHEQVALRAYQIWQERGCTHGHDCEDWVKAEEELNRPGSSQ